MTIKTFVIGAVVALVIQSGFLANIIYDRASRLTNGQEVLLKSVMVDPRDLFRGHYTRLQLEISSVKRSSVEVVGDVKRKASAYIELAPSPDGYWKAIKVHAAKPISSSGPILKATAIGVTDIQEGTFTFRFPFDRYFAPKKRAKELEKQQLRGKLGVILAVAKDGLAVIKGISVDNKLIYNEPLI